MVRAKFPANGKTLELSENALTAIMLSVIEVFPREADGRIWGSNGGDIYHVKTANPIQTAIRTTGRVDCGNKAAMQRLRSIEDSLRSSRVNMLGGYHSHPTADSLNHPSEDDIHFFKELMAERKQSSWLEIIAHVQRYKTQEPSARVISTKQNSRKLTVRIRDTEYAGYVFTLGAFMSHANGDVHELKVTHTNSYKQ